MELLAIFDLDHTLIKPNDGRPFPKSADDWQWLRDCVPSVVARYHEEGYKVVIVSDQTKQKPWKFEMITNVTNIMKALNVPIKLIVATESFDRKPNPKLFKQEFPGKLDPRSFFCGDAAGRPKDWSGKDRDFALNIGVQFITPEDMFPLASDVDEFKMQENLTYVIIMVGYPSSGKTTWAKTIAIDHECIPSSDRLLKIAEALYAQGRRKLIFDACHASISSRAAYIKWATDYNLSISIAWRDVPIDVAMEYNKSSNRILPAVSFYTFRKRFEAPTSDEACVFKI